LARNLPHRDEQHRQIQHQQHIVLPTADGLLQNVRIGYRMAHYAQNIQEKQGSNCK